MSVLRDVYRVRTHKETRISTQKWSAGQKAKTTCAQLSRNSPHPPLYKYSTWHMPSLTGQIHEEIISALTHSLLTKVQFQHLVPFGHQHLHIADALLYIIAQCCRTGNGCESVGQLQSVSYVTPLPECIQRYHLLLSPIFLLSFFPVASMNALAFFFFFFCFTRTLIIGWVTPQTLTQTCTILMKDDTNDSM